MDVIAAAGTATAIAAKRATSVIPIVFAGATDPVGVGLVASLARPGGNVTGVSSQQVDLVGKRIELLREIIPGFRQLAILVNVENPNNVLESREVQSAARTIGFEATPFEIRGAKDIAPAFAALKGRADAVYIPPDAFFITNRSQVSALALDARVATIYGFREDVEAGGLLSYGPHLPEIIRRSADYVDKILRGAKAGDIPVEQPTKFELVGQPEDRAGARPPTPRPVDRTRRRGDRVKRRELILALGAAMVAGPRSASAQRIPRIGCLASGSSESHGPFVAALQQGLAALGYVGGARRDLRSALGGRAARTPGAPRG